MAEDTVRAEVVVRGRVQGVYFRGQTDTHARSLGVAGWVRNEPDGTVSAVFEGSRARVETLVDWCRQGPRGAQVDELDVAWEEPQGLVGFEIR